MSRAAPQLQPRPPDGGIRKASRPTPLEPFSALVPPAGCNRHPAFAEPDPVVLRRQFTGLLQGGLETVVRQPIKIQAAELPEDPNWVLQGRKTGLAEELVVVKSALDLIDVT